MGSATTTACRVSALAVCACAGVALLGPTGGASLAAMVGLATAGASGSFLHQIVDGVLSWFGGQKRGPTTLPANHDLDGLTASAIKLVLENARDGLPTDDPRRGVLERLADTPVATIVAVMQAEDERLVGDAEIVGTLGTPAGGQTTTVATPEYWQGFVAALMTRTDADLQSSALKTPIRDVTHVFTLAARAIKDATKYIFVNDINAHEEDRGATDAAAYAAGLLHAHVAAFANDVLRGTFGPQGRFFIAALFNVLSTITAAVQRPPAGVALTDEHGAQLKAWVREATREALAAGKALPAPQSDDEHAAAAQVEGQAHALGETLKQMGADIGFIRAGMARWSDTLAPDLVLPARVTDTTTTRDRFIYRTRRLAVVGRDEELNELNAWLDTTAPFSWDLWVGPAGSGKSRLALELCDRRDDWDAGFFKFGGPHTPNWRDWVPKTNTLVIFDYVAEDAERIGQLADLFARRAVGHKMPPLPSDVKVRFLLLERAAVRGADGAPATPGTDASAPPGPTQADAPAQKLEAPWLGVLRTAAKQNGAGVEAVYARGGLNHPGRYLGGVGVDAATAIIRAEHASAHDAAGTPPPEITAEQVRSRLFAATRIDAHLRPLFVAMTAEAIREKGGVFDAPDGGTGIDVLVQYINEKEWTHARERLRAFKDGPAAEMDYWARLVCLATMCGGLTNPQGRDAHGRPVSGRRLLAEALDQSAALGLPTRHQYGNGSRYDLLVSGASMHEAPKLEPDVLGEGFVLWWLEHHELAPRALIDAAWRLGMTDFVRRAAENFPARAEASGLLDPAAAADPASLAAALTALGVREFLRGDLAALCARGRRLLSMVEADGVTPTYPPRLRALGAFMWMHATATPEELDKLAKAVDGLLAAGDLDAASRADLAKGLTNAIAQAGADRARADDVLKRLQALADAHPDDAAVLEPLASGLNNAIAHAGADHARADDVLNRLQSLADAHPDDAAVREQLAKALFNAFYYAPANSARADDVLKRLQAMADAHPDDAAVREQLASGLTNVIADAGAEHARADDALKRLQDLADAYPAEAAVREHLAKGLNNAIAHAGAEHARVDDLLNRLQSLADAHRDNAAVREQLANGLFNSFNNAPANSARADDVRKRLQALADAHPDDAAVREQLANGLFHAFYNTPANSGRADDVLKRLQGLADAHPDDAAVGKVAWKACGAAFVKSLESGPPQPGHLHGVAALLPRLGFDGDVRNMTRDLIQAVIKVIAQSPEPLKSELDAAGGVLWRAFQETFGADEGIA